MRDSTDAATLAANGSHLSAAFQLMSGWANALPNELCKASGKASRAVLAAFVLVSAEQDQRIRLITTGDYDRDLFWYDTISAAQRVIEWAREVWLRSERRRRKITIIQVSDLILAERKSQSKAAHELGVDETAIRNRYNQALKAIEEAATDREIVLNSGGECYNNKIHQFIDGWQKRLAKIGETAVWQNPEIGLSPTVSLREQRLPTKPKRRISRPIANVWHDFSKAQVRDATALLVDAYVIDEGAITQCRAGLNHFADGHWRKAGRRMKARKRG